MRQNPAMSVLAEVKAGLTPLVDLVYPPRCPLCGAATAHQGGLCLECWTGIETISEQEDGVIAATRYNDISRQLILNFKHGGKISLAGMLGRMMAQRLPDATADGLAALLVPVPLHRFRLLERGFNQSALLAQELARRGKGVLSVDALVRRKRTPSLGGLGGEARKEALRGAIAVRGSRRELIAGRDVWLVDDVYTSGATSSACIAALMEGGARSVRLVCFARVGTR
ncbi:MAG: ComF family protein [Pseudomonadota bacterium]